MKKPHEQDLTAEPTETPREGDTWLYRDEDEAVAVVFGDVGDGWASLFKAAPDMARALMAVRDSGSRALNAGWVELTVDSETWAAIHSALRKAGVLP